MLAVSAPAAALPPDSALRTEYHFGPGEKEAGEPHTPYHEFLFKLSRLKDRLYTPTARALAEARHRYLAEYFERLALEVRGEA